MKFEYQQIRTMKCGTIKIWSNIRM